VLGVMSGPPLSGETATDCLRWGEWMCILVEAWRAPSSRRRWRSCGDSAMLESTRTRRCGRLRQMGSRSAKVHSRWKVFETAVCAKTRARNWASIGNGAAARHAAQPTTYYG
jgi:hypothetical protein